MASNASNSRILVKPIVELTKVAGYVLGASALILQVFDDPLVRIVIAIALILLAGSWLYSAIKQARAEAALQQRILGPDERPLASRLAFPWAALQFPIAATMFAAVLLVWVGWINIPWALQPAKIDAVSTTSTGERTYVRVSPVVANPATITETDRAAPPPIAFTFTSALNEEKAREATRYVTGERLSFNLAANKHLPPIQLKSIRITVTSYMTFAEYDAKIGRAAYKTVSHMAVAWDTPMIFVEIAKATVGKVYEPTFISTLHEETATVKPWELSQVMLDSDFHQSFVVHIDAKEPGVYGYRADAVFCNRLGCYSPLTITENRTIIFEEPPKPDDKNESPAPTSNDVRF